MNTGAHGAKQTIQEGGFGDVALVEIPDDAGDFYIGPDRPLGEESLPNHNCSIAAADMLVG